MRLRVGFGRVMRELTNAMLQDFEVTFFPRSVLVETLDVGSEHPTECHSASPIDDLNRQQGSARFTPMSQPACNFQRTVVIRLYVCDTSTST